MIEMTENRQPRATQIMVTVFLSLREDAPTWLVESELLESCDTVAARVEAKYSGVQVVAVQATVV